MADAKKLQQSSKGTGVFDTPNTEIRLGIEKSIPAPAAPANPQYPVPWREQFWKDTLSKEELKQHCLRCKEMGHGHQHCPYPVLYKTVRGVGGGPDQVVEVVWKPLKGTYRCSRCGRRGHNRRTCHGPVFY